MKKLLVLFPRLRHIAIRKDPGLIPYYFSSHLGWDSHFLYCQVEPGEIRGPGDFHDMVTTHALGFTDDRRIRVARMLRFLQRNASEFDALLLYQPGWESFFYAALFRRFSRNGVVFLKLDMDEPTAKMLMRVDKTWRQRATDRLQRLAPIDFYSVETTRIQERIATHFERLGLRLELVPNGVSFQFEQDLSKLRKGKEKLLITVGRLGKPQKNTELLLKTLAKLSEQEWSEWKCALIGPTTQEFDRWLDQFFEQHPRLKNRIEVTGAIYDTERLFDYYRRARIFCLTSRWESFGLVLSEALFFGCTVVTTEVGAARDLIGGRDLGDLIPSEDEEQFYRALLQRMSEPREAAVERVQRAHDRVQQHFRWESIVLKYATLIESARAQRQGAS